MFCKYCGAYIDDDARFCSQCGKRVNESNNNEDAHYDGCDHYKGEEIKGCEHEEDRSSVGYGILSFFIPLIGLILFLSWNSERPKKAKSCIIGAIIGFIFSIITGSFVYTFVIAFLEELFMYI